MRLSPGMGLTMFVILTSKPGNFRTEPVAGVEPVAAYDYMFFGQRKARFVIAKLEQDVKVRVIEDVPGGTVNLVTSKFLEKFDTLERAKAELDHLISFGRMDTRLEPVPLEKA